METACFIVSSGQVVSGDELFWSADGFHFTSNPELGIIPHDQIRRVDLNRVIYRVGSTSETFRPDQIIRCSNGHLVVDQNRFFPFGSLQIELLPENPRIAAITEKISRQPPLVTTSPSPVVRIRPNQARNPYDDLMSVVMAPLEERRWLRHELSVQNGQTLHEERSSGMEKPQGDQRPHEVLDLMGSDSPDTTSSIEEAGFPGVRRSLRAKAVDTDPHSMTWTRRLSELKPSRVGTRDFPMSSPNAIEQEAERLLSRHHHLKKILFPSRHEHANEAYCPDLFNPMTCPKRGYHETELMETYQRLFPPFNFRNEADWERFETTRLFFMTVGAPDDWEDSYGESYETRDRVYAYVYPGRPDSLEFFSEEELISSFLQEEDFVNPRSLRGQRLIFSSDQIICFLALLEERGADSPLRGIIQDLKGSRSRILREMRILLAHDLFRDCLSEMFRLAMLMRGWTGEGDYPFRSATTNGQVDHYKLSCGLTVLRDRLYDDWQQFQGIRLLNYRGRTWTFEESRRTLYERLIPLMNNELCIRQTSAIFAWTSWYYQNEFFQIQLFPLDELDYVS